MAADGYPSLADPDVHFKLDESSGDTAENSGTGSNGTLANFPASPKWETGNFGNALHFDGVDSKVTGFSPFGAAPSALTISFWVKFDALFSSASGADFDVVNFNDDVDPDGQTDFIMMRMESDDGKMHVLVRRSSSDQTTLVTTKASWAADTWFHIVLVGDDSGMELFVDGASQDSEAGNDIPEAMQHAALGLNVYNNTRPFAGALDEILIWNDFKADSDDVTTLNNGPQETAAGGDAGFTYMMGLGGLAAAGIGAASKLGAMFSRTKDGLLVPKRHPLALENPLNAAVKS